jgi:hypothetical protein
MRLRSRSASNVDDAHELMPKLSGCSKPCADERKKTTAQVHQLLLNNRVQTTDFPGDSLLNLAGYSRKICDVATVL